MPLDARLENERLRKLYEDGITDKINVLLMGNAGTGKTFILRTARKPVFVDCFERGGVTCLREYIKKGEILARRWDNEDPMAPTVFEQWKREFTEKCIGNYFNQFGTYCLDSSTKWTEAIMNEQLKQKKRPGQAPVWQEDYDPVKVQSLVWLKRVLNLPCDVIVTGHLEPHKDEITGSIEYRYVSIGRAAVTIPLEFDEKWISLIRDTSQGVEYKILTQSTRRHQASSRLAALGKLEAYEEPDLKAILKKCGYDTKDKPLLFQQEKKGK